MSDNDAYYAFVYNLCASILRAVAETKPGFAPHAMYGLLDTVESWMTAARRRTT